LGEQLFGQAHALDVERRLVRDRRQQVALTLAKLVAAGRVEVDQADRAALAQQRHADRRANIGANNTLRAAEVDPRVAREHRFVAVERTPRDRRADHRVALGGRIDDHRDQFGGLE
jgi:hypothetical protein